jgi:L-2-hydroxyglutarate oxidase LhgO
MVLGPKKSAEIALKIFIKSTQEAIEKKKPNFNFFRSYKGLWCIKS